MEKYTHLKGEERLQLYALLQIGEKKEAIAEKIGRNISTIYREIKRNKKMIGIKNNNNPKAKKDPDNYYYLPEIAEKKYLERRKESKQKCPLKTFVLYDYVLEKLKIGWTPKLIAGRAKREGLGSISHECIYQFIYSPFAKSLELWKYLPRAHKRRRKKVDRKQKRTLIPNRIGIEERPKEVEDRKEFGHWEDDSIVGVGTGSALNTKRERMTRYMMVTKIPRKTARHTRIASVRRFKPLPPGAKKTNTMDNGCEFTQHEKTTKQTGVKGFFANPYASWERGTNENGNGLVRRFFPKKTDFDKITPKEIKRVEDWINHRPMECLGFKTPYEVFHEQLALCHSNSTYP